MTDDDGSPRDPGPQGHPSARRSPDPLPLVPLVLAVAAAILLLGGVLFALATADADATGSADRFRLLGQAANPFIAFLALTASALVAHARRHPDNGDVAYGAVASGISTAIALAVVLLALNGVLTDFTGDTTALFRLSAVVSRLSTLVLSGVTLWLAFVSGPARP